ncbi:hypothetical protein SCLARK_001595 [Spiroplasma clarkii]|nr:hypothetical protein SCLARK_001595 [Spiroplasma clarkii]
MLWSVLGILAIILAIVFLIYMTTSKSITTIFKRKNNLNFKHSFTYEHVLQGLGTIQNIKEVENEWISVFAVNLVNEKYLKRIGVKVTWKDNQLSLMVKGFNLTNFYKRLAKDIKDL